ncbi:MAG: hypothetical protein LBK72_08435 [Bifidobacteriaceae bacterium]|nr:hypothetical protein [Bifidobacteriaceae bacterium]
MSTAGQDGKFLPLDESEVLVEDPLEIAFRQCPPVFLDGGVPTTQLFYESTGDKGKLSAARSSLVSAQVAYEERLAAGGKTAGTYGVSVGEVLTAGSRVVDDSAMTGPTGGPTGHVFIDLRHLASRIERRRFAAAMRNAAMARGRLWPRA